MRSNKNKRAVLAALSLFCGAAVAVGVLTAQSFAGGPTVVNAEDTLLYEADFEGLGTSATADEIYGATLLAGANRSVVQSGSAYIEAPYTFWDNGYQQAMLYIDTNRAGMSSTNVSKTYTYSLEFEAYGLVSSVVLMLRGEDTAAYNSVVTFNPDGSAFASNYGIEKYVTLSSAAKNADGWWTVEFTARGTGSYITSEWSMVTSDYETANAEGNTGLRISKFDIEEGDNGIYSLAVTPGLVGNDAVFSSTGFAGIASASTKAGAGIEGKSLKAVYDFWSAADGGWQKEPLYINENAADITMQEGKRYVVAFETSLFGRVQQAHCLFSQIGADGIDSQVILKGDGSYETAEYGATKIFESCEVSRTGSVFKVRVVVNGFGGKFKLSINMLSSDADGANEAKDTGLYLDNFTISEKDSDTPVSDLPDLSGEYKTIFAADFNTTPLETSGSDAMFHATGFAGVSGGQLGIAENGIDDTRCMRVGYEFYSAEEGGWQKSNAYLDSGKTSGTLSESIYRFTMKIKPFGSWEKMVVGFQNPAYVSEFVYLNKDGTATEEKNANGMLIKAECEYSDGVYELTVYMYGTDGYIFNFFNMQYSASESSGAEADTGFYLDDYKFAKQKAAEEGGLNKKSSFYNKATDGDFVTAATFAEISEVRIGEKILSGEEYAFEGGFLTVSESVLKALAPGRYALTAVSAGGNEAEIELVVEDAALGTVYAADFTAMPVLSGDQAAKDAFYQNSFMDPGYQNVYTADEAGNRVIKFVSPDGVSESYTDMFQFNPQEGRLNSLTKDKWHTVSMDWKADAGGAIRVRANVFENGLNTEIFLMEIDLGNNSRTDDGKQSYLASWEVKEKGDGWYNLTISFLFEGEGFGEKAAAYLIFSSAKEAEDTAWYLDNIEVKSELFPSFVSGNAQYDLASGAAPYYLLDLCRTFEITSVSVGDRTLVGDADYTLSTTPVGYTRLEFSKSFCAEYELGSETAFVVSTSKGTDMNLSFKVIDTSPVLPEETIAFDKAEKNELSFEADLAGYDVSRISIGDADLTGTEYYLNAQGRLVFKYDYLKNFAVGNYEFVLLTSSGASGRFTIGISDTSPVFSEAPVYEKSVGGDFAVGLELNGREIVSVVLGGKELTEEQYSYDDGKLIVKADVMESLVAGEYDLTATTVADAAVKVTVKDAPPVITGEYTVTQGEALAIDVELFGKEILSVTVEGLVLREGEYSYADGKLTIGGEVFTEVAAGERTLILVTAGGRAELIFVVREKTSEQTDSSSGGGVVGVDSGCGSTLAGMVPFFGIGAALAAFFVRKRR